MKVMPLTINNYLLNNNNQKRENNEVAFTARRLHPYLTDLPKNLYDAFVESPAVKKWLEAGTPKTRWGKFKDLFQRDKYLHASLCFRNPVENTGELNIWVTTGLNRITESAPMIEADKAALKQDPAYIINPEGKRGFHSVNKYLIVENLTEKVKALKTLTTEKWTIKSYVRHRDYGIPATHDVMGGYRG